MWIVLSVFPAAEMPAGEAVGGRQATLLAKGPGYFVHAVPHSQGYQFLHMETETGVLKPLLSVGPDVDANPYSEKLFGGQVLGVASDDDRLYISVLHVPPCRDGSKVASHKLSRGLAEAHLYVFSIEDGSVLHREDIRIPRDGDAPVATLGEGWLSLRPDGVVCQQIGLIFEGRRLTSRYDPLSGTELPVETNVADPGRDYGR